RTDAGHDLALGQMPMAHQPRQSAVSLSAWPPRKPAISASTACANSARAPLRKISVNGSLKVPGCASLITLSWVTAYHSFGGEVEAFEHPTIRRLTPSSRHQLSRIAHVTLWVPLVAIGALYFHELGNEIYRFSQKCRELV